MPRALKKFMSRVIVGGRGLSSLAVCPPGTLNLAGANDHMQAGDVKLFCAGGFRHRLSDLV